MQKEIIFHIRSFFTDSGLVIIAGSGGEPGSQHDSSHLPEAEAAALWNKTRQHNFVKLLILLIRGIWRYKVVLVF